MSVKHGPVTLLSVVEAAGGGLKLLVAEGESVPGPILEIGNTNSRYRFSIGAEVRRVLERPRPRHHCAVGSATSQARSRNSASCCSMEVAKVCEKKPCS